MRGGLRLRFFYAEQMTFAKMAQLRRGALVEIRNFEQVRQNVVAVKAKQRVEIENQSRDGRDEHDVVGNAVNDARRRLRPDERRDGGKK